MFTIMAAFWGAAYLIPYKAAADQVPVEYLVLPTLFFAAVLNTLVILFYKPRFLFRINQFSFGVAILLGIFSALGNEAMAHALAWIEPGVASVLLRTQVIYVTVGGWWLLREKMTYRFWIGAAIAFGGVLLLQQNSPDIVSGSIKGILWALLAALSFASMQVLVRKTVHRIDPLMVNGLRLWLAALVVACIPGRVNLLPQTDYKIWLLTGSAALFGPVIGRIFLMLALRTIPAALSTLVLFVSPVFAFLLGGSILGYWPGTGECLGCVVILIGISLPVAEALKQSQSS